jgi:hypothetical protein
MTNAGNFLRTIGRGLGIGVDTPEQKHPELFSQYMISLEGLWLGLGKTQAEVDLNPTLKRISNLLEACKVTKDDWDENWRNAWQAEQLMSGFLEQEVLVPEAEKRLFEAEKLKLSTAAHFTTKWQKAGEEADPVKKVAIMRPLYRSLLGDLHWRYSKQSLDRKIRSQMAGMVHKLATILIFLAVLPFIPLYGGDSVGTWLFTASSGSMRAHFYGLYTAATFGLLGALFSRLIYMQSNFARLEYEDLINTFQSKALAVRMLVGMIGALIVFYAILGNLLSGDLFPDLSDLKLEAVRAPDSNFAKLVIWTFLGGFSERLVPDFLSRTEASASKTS